MLKVEKGQFLSLKELRTFKDYNINLSKEKELSFIFEKFNFESCTSNELISKTKECLKKIKQLKIENPSCIPYWAKFGVHNFIGTFTSQAKVKNESGEVIPTELVTPGLQINGNPKNQYINVDPNATAVASEDLDKLKSGEMEEAYLVLPGVVEKLKEIAEKKQE